MESRHYQFNDIRVTRAKFDQQVTALKQNIQSYRREGIICLGIEFPIFEFAFLAKASAFGVNVSVPGPQLGGNQIQQIMVYRSVPQFLFSVRLDYSNFDIVPPSLRIINPFTSELTVEVDTVPFITPAQQNVNDLVDKRFEVMNQSIIIKDNEGQLFFCLRGVKEYHEHPQHNGDSWFRFRLKGKGDILNILDQLQLYSISNLNAQLDQQKMIIFPNA